MNEAEARRILGDTITNDGRLENWNNYVEWSPPEGPNVDLDGTFSVKFLKAIIWWVENKQRGRKKNA